MAGKDEHHGVHVGRLQARRHEQRGLDADARLGTHHGVGGKHALHRAKRVRPHVVAHTHVGDCALNGNSLNEDRLCLVLPGISQLVARQRVVVGAHVGLKPIDCGTADVQHFLRVGAHPGKHVVRFDDAELVALKREVVQAVQRDCLRFLGDEPVGTQVGHRERELGVALAGQVARIACHRRLDHEVRDFGRGSYLLAVELGEPVHLHLDEHVALAAFGENRNVGHRIRRGIEVGVDLIVQRVLHYDAGARTRTRGKRVGGVLELGAHEGIHELLVMQHDVGLTHQKPRSRVGHEDVVAHKRDIVGVEFLLVGRDLLDVMRPQVTHVGRKVEHPVVVAHLAERAVHRIEQLEVVGIGTLRRLDLHLHKRVARMVVAGVKRQGARHNHAHIHAETDLRAGLLGGERVVNGLEFLVARVAQVHKVEHRLGIGGIAVLNRRRVHGGEILNLSLEQRAQSREALKWICGKVVKGTRLSRGGVIRVGQWHGSGQQTHGMGCAHRRRHSDRRGEGKSCQGKRASRAGMVGIGWFHG